MVDEEEVGYRWETEYEKTWEAIREDDAGSLQASLDEIISQRKRQYRQHMPEHVRLEMMRHLYIIIDFSEAMAEHDLKPNRLVATLKNVEHFVEEYFDQNPISQLGIIITLKRVAEKISEMGGNPRRHMDLLQELRKRQCEGEPSFQNALTIAVSTLRHMPQHSSREVIYIAGSLSSCDPGDIHQTLKEMKEQKIRCSVISLAAEVHIFKHTAKLTHGDYNVILDESHLKSLILSYVKPPTATEETQSALVKMGFPHATMEKPSDKIVIRKCMCHLNIKNIDGSCAYACPQCQSLYCELPMDCKICGLTLVSAPHLARSYHHLFPLEPFAEKVLEENTNCGGCLIELRAGKFGYVCNSCRSVFCIDCDVFLHESVHSCPNCNLSSS